jgi:hypothetical protein
VYYNRDGTPIPDAMEWARQFEGTSSRRVARTKVTDAADPSKSFDVSTVFIGLDHGFGDGPPLIFESMTFAEGDSMDEMCERYSTETQARQGHTLMVVEVAKDCIDPIVMDIE